VVSLNLAHPVFAYYQFNLEFACKFFQIDSCLLTEFDFYFETSILCHR